MWLLKVGGWTYYQEFDISLTNHENTYISQKHMWHSCMGAAGTMVQLSFYDVEGGVSVREIP